MVGDYLLIDKRFHDVNLNIECAQGNTSVRLCSISVTEATYGNENFLISVFYNILTYTKLFLIVW